MSYENSYEVGTLTASRQTSIVKMAEPATLTLDSSGHVKYASDSAEQLFGYLSGELRGLYISALVSALDEIEVPDNDAILLVKYLSHCGVAFIAHRKNHESFDCNLFVSTLSDPRNGGYRIVVSEAQNNSIKTASDAQDQFNQAGLRTGIGVVTATGNAMPPPKRLAG